MPYDVEKSDDMKSMKDKLKKTYKNVSDTAARQAIHVFNSIMDKHNDEGRAWAGVYSQLNSRGLSKKKKANQLPFQAHLVRHAYYFPQDRKPILRFMRQAGWVPGELDENNHGWDPGRPRGETYDYENDGSQVPPKRNNFGKELDENDEPQESIERVASVTDAVSAFKTLASTLESIEGKIKTKLEAEGFDVRWVQFTHRSLPKGSWTEMTGTDCFLDIRLQDQEPALGTKEMQVLLAKILNTAHIEVDPVSDGWEIEAHFTLE